MNYNNIRNTLNNYYHGGALEKSAEGIRAAVYKTMDAYAEENPHLSSYKLKSKLYDVIADNLRPRIFPELPFYFEAGALVAHCDGMYNRGAEHANGWLYNRNKHIFTDIDPFGMELYKNMYVQCGIYADMMHLGLPLNKIFKVGLSGILAELDDARSECKTELEEDFIMCCIAGINALWKIEKKFALELRNSGNFSLADIAERVPYNPPKTMHEGLCTLAFMRKSLGALEGMGFSSFGRVDVLLESLYENDIKSGVSEEELLDLTTRFLLIQDCTFNRNLPIDKPSEHELENTLTLGGCDIDGKFVYNGVTKLFLKARENQDIIYPKMMLRFSYNSPKEYLETICKPLISGKSFSLYANDDSIIPALEKSGVDKEDAYDYAIGGCWDILLQNVAIHNSGEYVSLLTPLQWSIYNQIESMRDKCLYFEPLDRCESFDELYSRYLGFVRKLLMQKHVIVSKGAREWHNVNPVGAISALMTSCIRSMRDVTNGGGKYNHETAYFACFAETADSLLAIKHLCFDKKYCTLSEHFEQCKNNWPNEELRQRAINAPSYGDGTEESTSFIAKFTEDLYNITRGLPNSQPGEVRIGSHLYTEVLWWGKGLPACPNGRRAGDYVSQGFSPSRLQKQISLSDVLYSIRCIDTTKFASGTSITLTLPVAKLDLDNAVALFRTMAQSGLQEIQPNFVDRNELLKAHKDPENNRHIIVRVCGFSAPFADLSFEYREEFLSRMLYNL